MNNKAIKIINKVFDVNLTESDNASYIDEVLHWDSFMIMELLAEIDMYYNKKVDLDKLFSVRTIEQLIQLIIDTLR